MVTSVAEGVIGLMARVSAQPFAGFAQHLSYGNTILSENTISFTKPGVGLAVELIVAGPDSCDVHGNVVCCPPRSVVLLH